VLRLVGFLLTFVLGVGGFIAVDYTMAKRWASSEDSQGLTFGEYIGGLSGRLSGGLASSSSGLPTTLAEMMPTAPKGWTVRPAVDSDIAGFLPKNGVKVPPEARTYVEEVGRTADGPGVESIVLTYEKGERRVVIKAVRFPDLIFTSFMAMQQRMELQMVQPEFRGRDFMTVRGLDVAEDILPDGFRARYFMAHVGAQIHLRVLASKRMTDDDLVPFFQTLHVKAMNASVIDKQDGLGDVPVIVLASALDDATRETYAADRAARERAEAQQREAERIAAEAEAQKASAAEANEAGTELTGEGSLTEQKDSGSKLLRGECQERAGTKFCGVGGGDAGE
jgi:hypothetical protein